MGFEQALSGLSAASQNLDTIGNNIANASTIGFKDARAQFADVYASSLWGANSTQIGIGTSLASVTPEFTQGNITTTGNPLDVAINGSGFFREVNSNGIISYSRDGQFSLDANGNVVNSAGSKVTGYQIPYGSTAPPGGSPVPLTLTQATVPPQATSTATMSLNLNSSSPVLAAPVAP